MKTQMIIRIDPDTKDKMTKIAKSEGKTTSRVMRELIQEYIHERDIGSYIDDLWNRIGGKLISRGITLKDVDRAIKQVRQSEQ